MSDLAGWLPPGTTPDQYAFYYERALLGLLMIDPTAIEFASAALTAADFHEARHARLFAELLRLRSEEFPELSPAAVGLALEASGTLAGCGGFEYLGNLVADPLAAPRMRDWLIGKVGEESARRGASQDMAQALKKAADRSFPISEALRDMEASAVARQYLAARHERPRTMAEIMEAVGSAWDGGHERMRFTPTFSPRLNHYLNGGWRPGSMYTVGGYSGTGKTIFLGNAALHAAWLAHLNPERWGIVLYYTYEMPAEELGERFVSTVARVEGRFDFQGGWSESDRRIADAGLERLARLPLYIRDQTRMGEGTVAEITADARKISRQTGRPISLVCVDYLGLLTAPRAGTGGRYETVTAVTRELKRMAVTLDVPVLTASQLNRQNESENRCPGRTDFRDSSSIIQDSDFVFGYWVPDWNDAEKVNSELGTPAGLKIIKGRRGATGRMVPLTLHLRRTMLVPPANDPVAPFDPSDLDDYLIDYIGLTENEPVLPTVGESSRTTKSARPAVHREEKAELEAVRLVKAIEVLQRSGVAEISQNAIKEFVGKPKKAEWGGAWFGRGVAFGEPRGWLTKTARVERGVTTYLYDLGPRAHVATSQTYGSLLGLGLSANEMAEREREETDEQAALAEIERAEATR